MSRRRWRPVPSLLAVALLLVGCSGTTARSVTLPAPRTACDRMADCGLTSSQMNFTITPSSGAPGTRVVLKVTGCIDPRGRSHGLSYNAVGDLHLSATELHQHYPHALVTVPAALQGTMLSGSYRVRYTPRPVGWFYARCLDTFAVRTFTITKARG